MSASREPRGPAQVVPSAGRCVLTRREVERRELQDNVKLNTEKLKEKVGDKIPDRLKDQIKLPEGLPGFLDELRPTIEAALAVTDRPALVSIATSNKDV